MKTRTLVLGIANVTLTAAIVYLLNSKEVPQMTRLEGLSQKQIAFLTALNGCS